MATASSHQVSPHLPSLEGAGGEGMLAFGSGVSGSGWSQRQVGAASWPWALQGLTCTPRSRPSPQACPGLQQQARVFESPPNPPQQGPYLVEPANTWPSMGTWPFVVLTSCPTHRELERK